MYVSLCNDLICDVMGSTFIAVGWIIMDHWVVTLCLSIRVSYDGYRRSVQCIIITLPPGKRTSIKVAQNMFANVHVSSLN